MEKIFLISCIVSLFFGNAFAQYDESQVPSYILPEILETNNGVVVETVEAWEKVRRPEILKMFSEKVFGITPSTDIKLRFEVIEKDSEALKGTAIRKQIRIFLGADPARFMDLLVYLPSKATAPVPVFLGLNFAGNQTIHSDPAILISEKWVPDWKDTGIVNNKGTIESRGSRARRWPVEEILNRGYGLATVYYGDLQEDRPDSYKGSVHELLDDKNATEHLSTAWGAIGGWAWGLSRAMDYLETDKNINASKVAVMGHSRLGKASLWAGAQDTRFALVISNDSGEGGAAITRRKYGETIEAINSKFPHWFATKYHDFNNKENELPVDFHMLLALMAPRPVYIASASEDLWADPKGEYLSAYAAGEAYGLYKLPSLPTPNPPSVESPVGGRQSVGYHMRKGKHDILIYDWEQYMNFADFHFKPKR